MITTILKNPFSLWIKWLFFKIYWENKNKNLYIGYLSNFINCTFGRYNKLYSEVFLNNVNLGDFTYIADGSRLSNTRIGKFCSVGPEVFSGFGIHPNSDFVSTHPAFYSKIMQSQVTFALESHFTENKQINIGNDVWIGARAIIMDGVTVEDGAIVGAGSVVTKNIPPYAVVGGVPARVLRYRFNSDEISFLLNLKWWDKDIEWLLKNQKLFLNIKNFINVL